MEYAIEAINNAGTCIGLRSADGIVFAAEKRVVSKLLAPSKVCEKTYMVDQHVSCLVAGLTSDAGILLDNARLSAQRYIIIWIALLPLDYVGYMSDISIRIKIGCLLSKSSDKFAIISNITHKTVVFAHSESRFSLADGTDISDSSCIRQIHRATILDGKPQSLVRQCVSCYACSHEYMT